MKRTVEFDPATGDTVIMEKHDNGGETCRRVQAHQFAHHARDPEWLALVPQHVHDQVKTHLERKKAGRAP